MGGDFVTVHAADLESESPPEDFQGVFLFRHKCVITVSDAAGLETTHCYRGTGVEHRSIVQAYGKVPRVTLRDESSLFCGMKAP